MKKTLLSVTALTVLAACGGPDAEPEAAETAVLDTTVMAPALPAPTAPAGAVTDPEIAAIVVAADRVDIENGELAQSKTSNPQVREFAERMITDHTAVNQQATALLTRLGVTPQDNPTSQQLVQGGNETRERLRGMSGVEFDRAYIGNEVAYHQTVLDALDNTLIPSAQNAEFRTLLEQTRPAFVAHLEHAQRVQAALGQS